MMYEAAASRGRLAHVREIMAEAVDGTSDRIESYAREVRRLNAQQDDTRRSAANRARAKRALQVLRSSDGHDLKVDAANIDDMVTRWNKRFVAAGLPPIGRR
jgi:hypothetical protein